VKKVKNKQIFIITLSASIFILLAFLIFPKTSFYLTNNQQASGKQYFNKKNNVKFVIPEELKLVEPGHTENFVSLYPKNQYIPGDYTGPSAVFISFYQQGYEDETETYLSNYGKSAQSETLSVNGYTVKHIWGTNQEGPGYGQENGVYIINKEGKSLLIRYDTIYEQQTELLLNSLQIE